MTNVTKKTFYKNLLPKKQKQAITLGIVFGYITGGVSLFASIITLSMLAVNSGSFPMTYAFSWIDGLLLLGLTIATQVTKNKICGLLLAILWAFEKIAQLFMGGGLNFIGGLIGGLLLWFFIYMTISLFQADKMWKDYCTKGTISAETSNEMKTQSDLNAYKNQSHPSYTLTAEEAKEAESVKPVKVETIIKDKTKDI